MRTGGTEETDGAVRTGERSKKLLKGRTREAEKIAAKGNAGPGGVGEYPYLQSLP